MILGGSAGVAFELDIRWLDAASVTITGSLVPPSRSAACTITTGFGPPIERPAGGCPVTDGDLFTGFSRFEELCAQDACLLAPINDVTIDLGIEQTVGAITVHTHLGRLYGDPDEGDWIDVEQSDDCVTFEEIYYPPPFSDETLIAVHEIGSRRARCIKVSFDGRSLDTVTEIGIW